MDSQLLALEDLGKKRYEHAQRALYAATLALDTAKKDLVRAQQELSDYQRQLPSMVASLYAKVIGSKTDTHAIADLLQKERKLTQKTADYEEELKKAQTNVSLQEDCVRQAQAALLYQERKKIALGELKKEYAQRERKIEEQQLAKIMDEFGGYRYIAKKC